MSGSGPTRADDDTTRLLPALSQQIQSGRAHLWGVGAALAGPFIELRRDRRTLR